MIFVCPRCRGERVGGTELLGQQVSCNGCGAKLSITETGGENQTFSNMIASGTPVLDAARSVHENRPKAMLDADKVEAKIRKQAKNARSEAIFSLFLAGFIVGPVALFRVSSARAMIQETGLCKDVEDHLSTTQTIAWTAIVLWIGLLTYKFVLS